LPEPGSTRPPPPAAGEPDVCATSVDGVWVYRLKPNEDSRGRLWEACRFSWIDPAEMIQWNVVESRAGVMRGMHWHNRHHDYVGAVAGRLVIAVADLRPGSPTQGVKQVFETGADRPEMVLIPPGVVHGFFSATDSIALYAVSRYWDPEDELGVRFDDPALGIEWPQAARGARLSERDAALPGLAEADSPPPWAPG
jgi:dTDP-4-dehydrorhamnose 3,5-epimerase